MTVAYVERNPARAGLVEAPWEHHWSSARVHVGLEGERRLTDLRRWQLEYTPGRWRQVLMSTVDEEADIERQRHATLTGRPYCEATRVAELEALLARPLSPQRRGRKKAQTAIPVGLPLVASTGEW